MHGRALCANNRNRALPRVSSKNTKGLGQKQELPTACGSPGIAQCTGSSAGQAAFSEADAQSSIRMLFESSQSYADIMEPDSRPRQHDLPACTGCGSSWECSSTRRGFDC